MFDQFNFEMFFCECVYVHVFYKFMYLENLNGEWKTITWELMRALLSPYLNHSWYRKGRWPKTLFLNVICFISRLSVHYVEEILGIICSADSL